MNIGIISLKKATIVNYKTITLLISGQCPIVTWLYNIKIYLLNIDKLSNDVIIYFKYC